MRKLLFFYFLFCAAMPNAQERDIRAVEVEVGGGMTFGAARLRHAGFDKTELGETGFMEIRYNPKRLPMDFGFQIRGTVFGRERRQNGEKLNFSSGNFVLTSDYNYRRNSNCMFFAGLGVGMSTFGNSARIEPLGNGAYVDNGSSSSICIMPRVGVEFWHRLRLTGAYVFEERANRHFDLSVGIAIGGGCK